MWSPTLFIKEGTPRYGGDITGEEEELLATGNFTMFLGKEI